MSFLSVFKRVTPFVLTFAAGLFIASFFVSISLPNLSGFKRKPSRYREYRQLKMDVDQLRLEREQLRNEIEQLQNQKNGIEFSFDDIQNAVPPPPPPPAPRAHYHRGTGTGSGFGGGK